MAFRAKIRSFIESAILFGSGASSARVRLKNNAGVLEARNAADSAFIVGRGADPVGANDWLTKQFFEANSGAVLEWGNDNLTASTTTRYLSPGFTDATALTSPIQFRAPRAGTMRNLRVRHALPAGNGNPIVYTLRVNGVATALSVSMASTASDGSNLVNTVAVAAGDLIDLEVTKAASTATSPTNIIAILSFV